LNTGAENFSQNKSLAFIMYFTGYRMGFKDLKKKMEETKKELVCQGEPFADIVTNN